MKHATRGLIVFTDGDDIATSIISKALVDRGCNWVDVRLGLNKCDEPDVQWEQYKYIFISPAFYAMFKSSLRLLENQKGHFVTICVREREKFRLLKRVHGATQQNGASKVLYICPNLFSLCAIVPK